MIVEGGGKYNVRLIPQTCNREDAIREIVGALDHLNAISDEIFSSIRTTLSSHRRQVEALSARVNVASEQVSALKGSQRAIRIISPAKYPCGGDEKTGAFGSTTFPTLVAKRVRDTPTLGHDCEEDEGKRCQRPFRFDTPIKHPKDLLSVFHVKEPKVGDLTQLDNGADVGLGRPPSTIKNMDSFFLFNTIENPYINYKMTERSLQDRNFGTLKLTRKGEEVHAETCPVVSHDSSADQKTDADDFYYSPSALEIPNIDVPESLPDLPGIAESFDLTDDLLSSPSFFPSKSKPAAVSSNPPKSSQNTTPSSLSFLPEKQSEFTALHTSTPANDRQPSPPKLETPRVEATAKPSVAPPVPPPPPPPPAATVLEKSTREDVNKSTASSSSAGGGDLRSSLMAAIREAGGSGNASLRSVKDRKYEAKKKKQDEKEKPVINDSQDGGNLMSDLKNTLAMRRRGISGIQDGPPKKAPGAVGDIMLSLAATIPTMDNSVESVPQVDSDDDDWD